MTGTEVIQAVLDRLTDSGAGLAMFSADEVAQWPLGSLETLVKAGLLKQASSAKAVECDGCEENCIMPVDVISTPGAKKTRAFIACDKREDVGRVPIEFARLQQWQITGELLAKAVARLLGLEQSPKADLDGQRWKLGPFKALRTRPHLTLNIKDGVTLGIAGHTLALADVLSFSGSRVAIDSAELVPLADGAARSATPCNRNCFFLAGDYWTVTFNGKTQAFKNTKGMRYIEYLVRKQGKEVLVSDLFYAINPPNHEAVNKDLSALSAQQLNEDGLSVSDLGDAGELITPEGQERIRAQLKNLQDRIEDAEELGDIEKQAKLEDERDRILSYMNAALGKGGCPRRASSAIEQIRKNVSRCIHRDIDRIESVLPELGQHLRCIKIRKFLAYAPNPKLEWYFEPR
jgi:hypothetical protein